MQVRIYDEKFKYLYVCAYNWYRLYELTQLFTEHKSF